MPYTFSPPTYLENSENAGRLFSRYKIPRGFTVVKENGVYRNVAFVPSGLFDTAEKVYQGGYIHPITDQEAADLIAAGYEVDGP